MRPELISCALACMQLVSCLTHAQNPVVSPDEDATYLHALALNAESLRSFDVLIRHETFEDIRFDWYVRDVTLTRLRIDFDTEKLLVAQRVESLMAKEGQDEKRRIVLIGGVYSDGELFETTHQGKPARKRLSFPEAFKRLAVVDVRFIGFGPFPVLSGQGDSFPVLLTASKNLTNIEAKYGAGNRIDLSRKTKFLNSNDVMHKQWLFDGQTLLPTSHRKSLIQEENGKQESYLMNREAYTWKDFDGVFVPTRIEGDDRGSRKESDTDGTRIAYDIDKTVQFHWFSVNEAMDEEAFSSNNLQPFDQFFQLIDPKLSKASTIIE